jgi:hypothetical protein
MTIVMAGERCRREIRLVMRRQTDDIMMMERLGWVRDGIVGVIAREDFRGFIFDVC